MEKNIEKFLKRLEKAKILDFAKKLLKRFKGSEAYLIGGSVRDALLGKKDEKDYDFVIRKVEAKDLEKFLNKLGQVNLVGKKFGVFKFLPFGLKLKTPLDIALPRTEHSLGIGGYRDFEIQSNPNIKIEEDLSRRDFTINTIALKAQSLGPKARSYTIVDSFGGLKDLKNKLIRAVGNPEERLKEDYSRILRAIRFSCQLDFVIEEETYKAIKKLIKNINQEYKEERIVPFETIAKEFLKTFYLNHLRAFDLYDRIDAFKELIPELLKMKSCPQPEIYHSEGDVWQHTRLCLEFLNSKEYKTQFKEKPGIELILGLLFHDLGKPYTIKTPQEGADRIRFNEHDEVGASLAKKICQRLRLTSFPDLKVNPERVAWLIKSHLLFLHGDINKMRNSTIEKYFFNPKFSGEDLLKLSFVDALASIPSSGKPNLENFYKMLKRIKELKELIKEKKVLPKPVLNGNKIMKIFNLRPGPEIGKLLKILKEAQLNKKIRTKKQAIDFLKSIVKAPQ